MPITKLRPTFTFTEARLQQLKSVVPEAFADGKVNWDALREAMGDHLEDESGEHFGFFWPGKREARRLASAPSNGTLVPMPGEGIHEESTRNLFIEGENLEVLKLLQKSYANRVKMVYIDPPYNTGNDFVYADHFADALDAYFRKAGSVAEEGELLTTNSRASGRFHSNWLSMMYPRLLLAHQLLADNGVMMVSIDDNEIHNLRIVLNEIFGEENFVDCIIWKKRYGGGSKEKYLVSLHEYILFFAKNVDALDPILVPLRQEAIERYYKSSDDNLDVRGPYRTHPLEATKSMGARPNLVFPIAAPDGTEVWPKRQWLWSKERVSSALSQGEIEFLQSRDGSWSVNTKQYLRDRDGGVRAAKAFSIVEDVYTQHGTNEIIETFGDAQVFPFAKPTELIKRLIEMGTSPDEECIIVDFFAGSGSTALATLRKNAEDGGLRRFILVQWPEPVPDAPSGTNSQLSTVAEIGKERIRRAISKLRAESLGAEAASTQAMDAGFRVFALERSHFREWEDFRGHDTKGYQMQLGQVAGSPLVDGWKKERVLSELMLQEGFPLDSKVTVRSEFQPSLVYTVESDSRDFSLWVCLDDEVAEETGQRLFHLREKDTFICLDSALTDELKVRLGDAINLHVI